MENILVGLDRDGVLIKDVSYLGREKNWKDQIEILPGVIEGLKLFITNKRIRLTVATNQAGVARGYFNEQRVKEINYEVDSMLKRRGIVIDDWEYCPYVPQEYALKKGIAFGNSYVISNKDFRMILRKPGVGMLENAAEEMGFKLKEFDKIFFIDDKRENIMTGINAGGTGIWIKPDLREKYEISFGKIKAKNLYCAAEWIIKSI